MIPNLIAEYYDGDLVHAVAAALKQLVGTYGIAVVSSKHPGLIRDRAARQSDRNRSGRRLKHARQRRDGIGRLHEKRHLPQ